MKVHFALRQTSQGNRGEVCIRRVEITEASENQLCEQKLALTDGGNKEINLPRQPNG
jgi:hypothetical protein